MRLHIVNIGSINIGYAEKIKSLLHNNIEKNYKDIVITDQNPDIVHLFGDWDMQTFFKVKSIYNRSIPLVFTSIGGLQSLISCNKMKTSYIIKQITKYISIIHVCGPIEKNLLSRINKNIKIHTISNPAISNIITIDEMVSQMIVLYRQTIMFHDNHICEQIKNKVNNICKSDAAISEICICILYIKYLHNRGFIPQSKLDELSQTLIKCQYDEEEMGKVLKNLSIYGYTSSLLSVLNKKSTLTEGFMPITDKEDKTAENILNCITNF